jgi:hypothetical protein
VTPNLPPTPSALQTFLPRNSNVDASKDSLAMSGTCLRGQTGATKTDKHNCGLVIQRLSIWFR